MEKIGKKDSSTQKIKKTKSAGTHRWIATLHLWPERVYITCQTTHISFGHSKLRRT